MKNPRMKKLIQFAAVAWLVIALGACSSAPTMSQMDAANYGPQPTIGQVRQGVWALGGVKAFADGTIPYYTLTQGWVPDLANPGGYIYGWQVQFPQDAANGGGMVTALFRDGTVIAATRVAAGETKPERIK